MVGTAVNGDGTGQDVAIGASEGFCVPGGLVLNDWFGVGAGLCVVETKVGGEGTPDWDYIGNVVELSPVNED